MGTIPSSGQVKKGEKHAGFRETYLDKHAKTFMHVPGPGAHRKYIDFVAYPRSGSTYQASTMGVGASRPAPTVEEGDETDAKRVVMSRPASAQMSKTKRIASLTSLRDAPKSKVPTSFHTPGPG